MLLLGIDLGTSSVKVSVVKADTQQLVASAQYPETESEIISLQTGWAEQSPDTWWEQVQLAVQPHGYLLRHILRIIGIRNDH